MWQRSAGHTKVPTALSTAPGPVPEETLNGCKGLIPASVVPT